MLFESGKHSEMHKVTTDTAPLKTRM